MISKNSSQRFSICCALIVSILSITQPSVFAKSVYVIPQHWGSAKLDAYEILTGDKEGQLEYRATYELLRSGAGDVDIDTKSNILFVTFENWEYVQLVNARTFLNEGTVLANGASNLAGIIVDHLDQDTTRVYTIDRGTNKLFVYDWDAEQKQLTLIPPDPNTGNVWHALASADPNIVGAVNGAGLAFDAATGTLYVSQFSGSGYYLLYSRYVHSFKRDNNWAPSGIIDLGQHEGIDNYAVDIDVDSQNGWLYAGGYNFNGNSHNNLIRFDLEENDPNAPGYAGHVEDIGAGVIGLAVSPGTRFVYLTSYNHLLEAWDTSLPLIGGWARIDEEQISSGAGVCVSEVDYVPPFDVTKDDDIDDCVIPRPGERIIYTICYNYNWTEPGDPSIYDFTSIYIEDHLPKEVDFVSAEPDVGYYDENSHSYIWIITPEAFGNPYCINITVEINNKVTPGKTITNSVVEIVSDIREQTYVDTAVIDTLICSCGNSGSIWYVDKDAVGGNDGTSWTDAFTTVQQALNVAFPCDEIWVAQGIYNPAGEPNLVNYVGLYGGFSGDETQRHERDWSIYTTVLCADPNNDDDIDKSFDDPNRMNENNYNYVLVAQDWIKQAVIDGFVIQRGKLAGIYCNGSSPLIEHNRIIDSLTGIYCDKTDAPAIRNNFLYGNGQGIYMSETAGQAEIINNTIADNMPIGLLFESGVEPFVTNCIFWGNDANDMIGCYTTYSCIERPVHLWDTTDPNNPVYLGIGQGNIDNDPLFVLNDYHLSAASLCINAGNPNLSYSYQQDYDREFRVIYGRVDMGADEYCDCEDTSDADFNADGIVSLLDYAQFSAAWLVESNDPNWNSLYDLAGEGFIIDANDLIVFAADWLWMSCAKMKEIVLEPQQQMMLINPGREDLFAMGESFKSETVLSVEAEATKSLDVQIREAEETIKFFEELWQTDPDVRKAINEKNWRNFMDELYKMLKELEDMTLTWKYYLQ